MPFEPFSYQYEGIAWLFSSQAALLADEMGLGKTMQTITAIRLLLRSGQARRIVLICPKPLIPNWQREFRTWAEELPVVTVEGNGARRRMLWTMPGIPILIANYELMARDIAEIPDEEQPKFDLLVLDEAQRIKNRDSNTAQTARFIRRRRSWRSPEHPSKTARTNSQHSSSSSKSSPKTAHPTSNNFRNSPKNSSFDAPRTW
jgi:SNF2 family DNA or RNA helicase